MAHEIIVVGAGIIGATTALRLTEAGHRVTAIDPEEPGGEAAASYGNGGWISPASIIPMSMPGLWRKVPGYLLDREGPLTLDIASVPRMMPWLWRFLLAGSTEAKVRKTAANLNWLISDGPARHLSLSGKVGNDRLVVQKGLLYAYPDRAAFEAEGLSWQIRRDNGLVFEEWDRASLRTRMPALSESYGFGVFVAAGAHCLDTGSYVAAIMRTAQSRGAMLKAAKVTALTGGGRPGVRLSTGETLQADRVIMAAGIHSRALMATLGIRVLLESERGYHITVANQPTPFDIPIMPSTGRMANTPTNMGLRLSGQVELAAIDRKPNWKRAEILRRHAWATYPYLAQTNPQDLRRWMGHRPSTPDGLPLIGAFTKEPNIIAAFGHGHIGIIAGPKTAELVAAGIDGALPPEAAVFMPRRVGQ